MDWQFLTDDKVIAELRQRCRQERLAQNVTQSELAERAGLGINTVRRYESDDHYSPSLETFIRVVRVLGAIDVLEQVLPPRAIDPLNPRAVERRRARPSAATAPPGSWTWGEQQ